MWGTKSLANRSNHSLLRTRTFIRAWCQRPNGLQMKNLLFVPNSVYLSLKGSSLMIFVFLTFLIASAHNKYIRCLEKPIIISDAS